MTSGEKMKSTASVFLGAFLISTQAMALCPAGTTPRPDTVEGRPACTLAASYLNTNLTLAASNAYILEGDTRIGADNRDSSTLTIEPGTRIYGATGSFLAVMRGSKIFSNGTKERPVVFTSLQRENPRPGLWGGVVLNGNAPINKCDAGASVCEAISEGIKNDPPKFGGRDANESSGRLKYTRVEWAGYELSKDNELNGVTLNGIGSGTEIDYIQVHRGADDGIEVFGGTVNLKHLLITDPDDDGLDWDFGWTGKAQFVMVEMESGTEDSNGIEADNLKSPMDASPRSNPILSNVTIAAKGDNAKLFNGILLRRGTGGQIYNAIVTGSFNVACVNLDDEETFRNAGGRSGDQVDQTGLKMETSIVNCGRGNNFEDKASDLFPVSAWFFGANKTNNLVTDPMLTGRLPAESSPANGRGRTPSFADGFFDEVDFIGALSPYADEDWTQGWTI